MSKASLRFARVSPRKARLVADLVRGKDVDEALELLTFARKKTAPLMKKLIESAVPNAENGAEIRSESVDIDGLYVKTVFVNEGSTLKRFRPRAMGRATPVRKPTSHITVVLDSRQE